MFDDAPARLREERQRLGMNQPDLGKLGGVSKNTQLAYESGASPITLDYLSKVAEHGVDSVYVLTGRHETEEVSAPAKATVPADPYDDDDLVEIAEINLRYGLGATFLNNPVTAERRRFSRAWIRNFTRASPQQLFWTIGDGDSMEPTIRSGEVILVDGSQQTPRITEGIWAVAIGEFGMVKRLHYAGEGRLELRSDNQLIPPIAVGEDELHIVGRVIAVVRRL